MDHYEVSILMLIGSSGSIYALIAEVAVNSTIIACPSQPHIPFSSIMLLTQAMQHATSHVVSTCHISQTTFIRDTTYSLPAAAGA